MYIHCTMLLFNMWQSLVLFPDSFNAPLGGNSPCWADNVLRVKIHWVDFLRSLSLLHTGHTVQNCLFCKNCIACYPHWAVTTITQREPEGEGYTVLLKQGTHKGRTAQICRRQRLLGMEGGRGGWKLFVWSLKPSGGRNMCYCFVTRVAGYRKKRQQEAGISSNCQLAAGCYFVIMFM